MAAKFALLLLVLYLSPPANARTAEICNPTGCWIIDTTMIGNRRFEDYRVTNGNPLVNVPQRRAILNTSPSDALACCAVNRYAGVQPTLPSLTYTSAALNINANSTNQAANLTLQNVRTSEGYFVPSLNLLINHCHNCLPTVFLTFNQNSNPTLGFPTSGLSWMYRSSEPLLPVPNLIGAPVERIPNLSALQPPVQRLLLATAAALPTLYANAGSVNISPSSGLPVWTREQVVQIATQVRDLIFSKPIRILPPLLTLTCELAVGTAYTTCQEINSLGQFGDLLVDYGAEYLRSGSSESLQSLYITLRNWAAANALMTYPGYIQGAPNQSDENIKYKLKVLVPTLAITWGMVRKNPAVREDDRILIDSWVSKLIAFATSLPNFQFHENTDNHRYLAQSGKMAWAIVTGNDAAFARGVEEFYIALHQMRADGSFPWEVGRGACATRYQAIALTDPIMIAELAASQGYDLYGLQVNGVTIHTGIQFLLDAIKDPSVILPYATNPYPRAVCDLPPGSPQDLTSVAYYTSNHIITAFIEQYVARFPDSTLAAELRGLPLPNGLAANRPLKFFQSGGNTTGLAMTDPFVKVSLAGSSDVIPVEGASGFLNVGISSSSFPWTAESSTPWVTLDNSSGVGTATLSYRVSANTTPYQRQASITVGNRVFLITQTALTVTGPVVAQGGVVNAASFALHPNPITPGSIVAVFGSNLNDGSVETSTRFGSDGKLVTSLGGSSVTFNGIPAPMFYSTPGQLGVQVPLELAGSNSASVEVTVNGQTSAAQTVFLHNVAPGIFTVNQQGTGRGVITHANGARVEPGNPGHPNEVLVMYATGLGAVSPPLATGESSAGNPTSIPVSVTLDGVAAEVLFSGSTPGTVGLNQINFRVPASTRTSGGVTVILSISGKLSNVSVPIAP